MLKVNTRVKILVNFISGPGFPKLAIPAGSLGTVTDVHKGSGYGVLMDDDPYKMPMFMYPSDIASV